MSDVFIVLDDLDAATARLTEATDTFERAHGDAQAAAGHVGHGGLSGKIMEFSDEWDIRRGNLLTSLTKLREHYSAVARTMRDLDSGLAQQLRDAAATAERRARDSQGGAASLGKGGRK